MADEVEKLTQMAKLAEQSERYDDMAEVSTIRHNVHNFYFFCGFFFCSKWRC